MTNSEGSINLILLLLVKQMYGLSPTLVILEYSGVDAVYRSHAACDALRDLEWSGDTTETMHGTPLLVRDLDTFPEY